MLKLILTLRWLTAFTDRVAENLRDANSRVIGAAINARSEALCATHEADKQIASSQKADAQRASDDLTAAIDAAYKQHTAALQDIERHAEYDRHSNRVTRAALRDELARLHYLDSETLDI